MLSNKRSRLPKHRKTEGRFGKRFKYTVPLQLPSSFPFPTDGKVSPSFLLSNKRSRLPKHRKNKRSFRKTLQIHRSFTAPFKLSISHRRQKHLCLFCSATKEVDCLNTGKQKVVSENASNTPFLYNSLQAFHFPQTAKASLSFLLSNKKYRIFGFRRPFPRFTASCIRRPFI